MGNGNVTATGTLTMGGGGLVQIVSVTTDIELLPVGKVKVDGNLEVTGTFDGDVTGSVFGDDSTVLVDGINNKVVGDIDTASLRTSESKIALGDAAGEVNQGANAVAIGRYAGGTDQESWATAVGGLSGANTQGDRATAIGSNSGQTGQGAGAVAIGAYAGNNGQGADAVAIGNAAGHTNQAANSIVINATGVILVQNSQASSTVIQPVRNASSANVMMYDPSNGELTHTATPGTLAANIDQATLAIGATTATTIGIGNAGSTTTINGIVNFGAALVAANITADDSIIIQTGVGDGNAITVFPKGTNTSINLRADALRLFGTPFTDSLAAQGGIVGDIKGSVVADDSTILVDSVGGKIVGDIESTNIHGQAFKADTIVNNTGDILDITAGTFLNIIRR